MTPVKNLKQHKGIHPFRKKVSQTSAREDHRNISKGASVNKECESCKQKINLWSLAVSLLLSLIKGVIGILGSSESLVADGLHSFYQSFIIVKSVFLEDDNRKTPFVYRPVWFAGLVISIMLIIGCGDVLVFSIVRIIKAAKGLLVRPSPYALYAGILSVLANQLLHRCSLCSGIETMKPHGQVRGPLGTGTEKNVKNVELTESLRLSVVISSIVIIGIAISRTLSPYGDAVAALVVAIILIPKVISLINQSFRITTD